MQPLKHGNDKNEKDYVYSKVRRFFGDRGVKVINNMKQRGRIGVIGETQ